MIQTIRTAVLVGLICCASLSAQNRTVRVAITSGIGDNGLWDQLVDRFEKKTGIKVETVSTGQKDGLADEFKKGGIDVVMMYSSDMMMTLAAQGYAIEVQPWMTSDLALVGPADDPAGVRRMNDLVEAVRMIALKKSPMVIHGSLGTDVVMRDVFQKLGIEPDPAHVTILLDDHQRRVLQTAAEKKAYTLISRVAFQSGKLDAGGLALLGGGDERLKRPFLIGLANPEKLSGAPVPEARELAKFLLSEETQKWIGDFGKGKFDSRSDYQPIRNLPPER